MARWRLSPGTHLREYKYWQYALSGKPALRMRMSAGDVIVRLSSLWHRGMPNRSKAIRPMLAFTWENGGSDLADPYTAHGGKIALLTNRYASEPQRAAAGARLCLAARAGKGLFVHSLSCSVGARHQATTIPRSKSASRQHARIKRRQSLTPCAAA